jgi:hypothetical protein
MFDYYLFQELYHEYVQLQKVIHVNFHEKSIPVDEDMHLN